MEEKVSDSTKNNRSLPDERYDIKLYKQAVKASKEAKRIAEKERRKKRVERTFLGIILFIVLCFGIYLISKIFVPKPEYIEAYEYPLSLSYEPIQEEIHPHTSLNLDVELSAQSAIAFNPVDGNILYEKDSSKRVDIASLTKLMSVVVALDTFDLDESITVSTDNIPQDLDWKLGLKDGDVITVENILKAMLISSYNDAAYVLANAYPYGGYEGFIKGMNRMAKVLRMYSSNFSNPAGIDDPLNYSTAHDVAILSSVVRKYPQVLDIVNMGKDTINWSSSDGLVSKEIMTTNQLYGTNKYMRGLKTGITDLAGQCFVGYFVYPSGNELITVIINSQDRFGETVLIEKYAREKLK